VTLKPGDAARLIRQTRSERTVLVGGQAVAFWIEYFGIPSRLAALTADIDFLGTRRDARSASARLSLPHRLHLAAPEDLPNTATLAVDLKGHPEPVRIDFLSGVMGVDSAEIARSAVTVAVEGGTLKVIHPVPLLKSKIWNLHRLPGKRSAAGIEQARLAVAIVAAYLRTADLKQRETLKTIEAVGKFAATTPARYARTQCRIDCLDAIPAEVPRPSGQARRTMQSLNRQGVCRP